MNVAANLNTGEARKRDRASAPSGRLAGAPAAREAKP